MNQPNVNTLLPRLQRWYHSQCDGNWEHASGITIQTLDNPGWMIEVNLESTALQDRPFSAIERPPGRDMPSGDWLSCSVSDRKFTGVGGPDKLAELIAIFLNWADGA